jgi:pilus assembly protein CpaF
MKSYTLKDLYKLKMLDEKQLQLFEQLACSEQTILFCGKGAAGKTTLLRAFINVMPEMERVLIAESDAEIFADKPYCIEQKIKKLNEGGRAVTLTDLVRDGLTMSLDTYCVGEMVGPEGWDFVKAAFTGHRALATIHSESAEDVFDRLLTLCKSQGIGESESTVRNMIGRGVDIVVYMKNFKVHKILEVSNYDEATGQFVYKEVDS